MRELRDTVKKLNHTKGRGDKPTPRGQKDSKSGPGQLALEAPKAPLKGARDAKGVRPQAGLDLDRPGYVGIRGKYYKRGLLIKLLVNSFGFTRWKADALCLSVVLSKETDAAKRHAECSEHDKAGHKSATDSCHAFSKTSELMALYDAQYQKDYVMKKPDFR
jgi:hypothetical protein